MGHANLWVTSGLKGNGVIGDFKKLPCRDAVDEPDTSHLDAVHGSGEARTELHTGVLLGSTAVDDTVMRQEFGTAAELGSEAGQNGGGDWNA